MKKTIIFSFVLVVSAVLGYIGFNHYTVSQSTREPAGVESQQNPPGHASEDHFPASNPDLAGQLHNEETSAALQGFLPGEGEIEELTLDITLPDIDLGKPAPVLKENLDKLKAAQQALNVRQAELQAQMDELRASLEDSQLTVADIDLSGIITPDQVLSSQLESLDSQALDDAALPNPGLKDYPLDPALKPDLQRDAGIAPEDVDAAFNVQNPPQ